MSEETSDETLTLQAAWVGLDELTVKAANQFVIQFDEHGFYLSVGMLPPPVLLGSQEEKLEQARRISVLPINSLGRYSLSEKAMRELVELLGKNLERFEARREDDEE